jgi:hypothetical protein
VNGGAVQRLNMLYERISPQRFFHAVMREYMKRSIHDQRSFKIRSGLTHNMVFEEVLLDKMSQSLGNTRLQKKLSRL